MFNFNGESVSNLTLCDVELCVYLYVILLYLFCGDFVIVDCAAKLAR
jgi:hypothetical protein